MKTLKFISAIIFLTIHPATSQEQRAPRPNILVIITDDMGFSDIGCYGGEIHTPNIDRLAEKGIRFTQFYNSARCWPTRSSLVFGYYSTQMGADPNLGAGNYVKWTKPLPRILGDLGYRTYHSGKWHVQGTGADSAHQAGFDRAYDEAQGYLYYTPFYHALDGEKLPQPSIEDDYFMDRAITDQMLGFLEEHAAEHAEQPFFAYLSFLGPHYPLKAPKANVDKYDGVYAAGWDVVRRQRYDRQMKLGFPKFWRLSEPESAVLSPHSPQDEQARKIQDEKLGFEDVYQYEPWENLSEQRRREQSDKMEIHAGMVDLIDEQVGRVLALLQEQGKMDNTLVLFLSDNGADSTQLLPDVQMPDHLVYKHDNHARWGSEYTSLALGPGWATASNTPFRRHKIWVHEGGISTPLVVHWPQGITTQTGGFNHSMGHVIDFVPTFVALAGGNLDRATPEAPLFPGKNLMPAFSGETVPREHLWFKHAGNRAFIKENMKAVSSFTDNNQWSLYDLSVDRTEMNDLRSSHMPTLRELVKEWDAIDKDFQQQGGYNAGNKK